jgi:1-acyl-sn-glycerol-3-phosphate acyltransferase
MNKRQSSSDEGNDYSLELGGWYRVSRWIVTLLLRIFARVEVHGLEHVPAEGPYLMVTNHLHWLDPPVLMAAFPYRCYVFAAAKRENHFLFGPLFRSLDAIWVRRGLVDRKAIRQALAVLEGGGVLGMAPEGTRSQTGVMQEGRTGAAYLAYRAQVPVLPVAITGQEKVFSLQGFFRWPQIRVVFAPVFGPPIVTENSKVTSAELRSFTNEIMYRLAALLPPEYRGYYKDVAIQRPDLSTQQTASGQ